jgi:hypothetical protein
VPGRPGLVTYPFPQRAGNGVESATPRSYASSDQSCTPFTAIMGTNARHQALSSLLLRWRHVCRGQARCRPSCPGGTDQTVYLVVDSFGANGTVYRKTEVERTDLETIIGDLMSGQFDDPACVIAFKTLELWFKDVAADIIAVEIQSHCDIDGESVPERVCIRVCEGLCREPCSLDPAACPSIGLMPRSRKPGSTVGIKGPASSNQRWRPRSIYPRLHSVSSRRRR